MRSELNEALLKLRNAIIEAEKRRAAQRLAGILVGAIIGGIIGLAGAPTLTWDHLESLSSGDLDDWADEAEIAIGEATWPEEDV